MSESRRCQLVRFAVNLAFYIDHQRPSAKGCWSTSLDPMSYPADRRNMNARMVIDACTPWNMMKEWPATVRNSEELEQRVRLKFRPALPGNW
jgi:3-polyprenyl-4-hydroxybenzoate decarboxylase